MKRDAVLCDIDHVLANAFHRDAMIGTNTWDEYHAAAAQDEPLHDMRDMIRALHAHGFNIIGLTARPEKWHTATMSWLLKHDIPLNELLMRPMSDFRPSPEMKVDLALKRFKSIQQEVLFLLEDREDVCTAFRALGITVLQVFGRRV